MERIVWKDQLERIIDLVADGVIVLSVDGMIIYANAKAQELLGVEDRIVIGHEFPNEIWRLMTVNGEPFPEDQRPFSLALRGKVEVWDVEYQIERPDGKRVTVSVRAVPFLNERNEVKAVALMLTDISHLRQAHDEMRDLCNHLLDMLEGINAGFFAFDTKGHITYANSRAAQLLGISKEQLESKDVREVVPQKVASRLEKVLQEAVTSKNSVSFNELHPAFGKQFEFHAYPHENGISVIFEMSEGKKKAC